MERRIQESKKTGNRKQFHISYLLIYLQTNPNLHVYSQHQKH